MSLFILGSVFLVATGYGQQLLIKHAEVPEYPPLAVQARLSGTLRFRVTVDSGEVTSVVPDPVNSRNLRILETAAMQNIQSWSFYAGRKTFDTEFVYEISGEEVVERVNPRIELNLPTSVRLVTHPVQPQTNSQH